MGGKRVDTIGQSGTGLMGCHGRDNGMAASNVIEGSFTVEKFVHFLEHDVVSPLLLSQFC